MSCSVEGCARVATVAGMCVPHRRRWRKTGVASGVIRSFDPGRGCSVVDCAGPHYSGGMCEKHHRRVVRHGDPEHVGQGGAGGRGRGPAGGNWRGDNIGYKAAHDRVRDRRGLASTHVCRHCDGPAAHWAYDHLDGDQRWGADKPGRAALAYSLDPDHYLPLCVACHNKFDAP